MIVTQSQSPGSPRDLLDRAREGDQQAWQILFEGCYPKIHRVVHRRLRGPIRKICDSTDIANEVMKSLVAKFNRFDFSTVAGLHAFLIQAAEKKVIDGHRRGSAKKRDLGRNQALGANNEYPFEPADDSPTASQVAVATEEAKILLEGLSAEEQRLVQLKMDGLTNSEVAREIGWNLRRVERCLAKLRPSSLD